MPESDLVSPRADSMALLANLARNAQDPAYAAAARRRAQLDALDRMLPPSRQPRRDRFSRAHSAGHRAIALLVLGSLGLVTGVAAAAIRTGAVGGRAVRFELVSEVHARTAQSDALQRQVAELRQAVATERDGALTQDASGRRQAAELADLDLAAGTVAVTGPGVLVTITDRPPGKTDAPAQQRGGRPGDGRVVDRDLQDLVNGLWASGAEAITVNDQRLTARTAIRSAGEAILVDFRPLSPPYSVQAIGPPDLRLRFVDGIAGRRLATYTALYGLGFQVGSAETMRLPAGSSPDLQAIDPTGSGPAPTAVPGATAGPR